MAEQEQDTSQLPVHFVLQLEPHELELYDNKKEKMIIVSSIDEKEKYDEVPSNIKGTYRSFKDILSSTKSIEKYTNLRV